MDEMVAIFGYGGVGVIISFIMLLNFFVSYRCFTKNNKKAALAAVLSVVVLVCLVLVIVLA